MGAHRPQLFDGGFSVSELTQTIGLKTNVEIRKIGKDGNVVEARNVHNLVVNQGLDAIVVEFMKGAGEESNFIAWGTGTASPSATDTALGSQQDYKLGQWWETATTGECKIEATFAKTQAGSHNATEVGLGGLVDPSAFKLYARATFTAISLSLGDALNVIWTVTFTDGSP